MRSVLVGRRRRRPTELLTDYIRVQLLEENKPLIPANSRRNNSSTLSEESKSGGGGRKNRPCWGVTAYTLCPALSADSDVIEHNNTTNGQSIYCESAFSILSR